MSKEEVNKKSAEAGADKESVLEEEVATQEPSSEQVVSELKDQMLRLQAEFDNYRKRMLKEREELRKFANEDLILSLLDVVDNFERALVSVDQVEDKTIVIEGVKMIEKQLKMILEQYGVKSIKTAGTVFDPGYHEAIAQEVSQDVEENHILEELQRGYQLHDKVIRFAKVKVAKPEEEDKNE